VAEQRQGGARHLRDQRDDGDMGWARARSARSQPPVAVSLLNVKTQHVKDTLEAFLETGRAHVKIAS
jgi:hypothetical protein